MPRGSTLRLPSTQTEGVLMRLQLMMVALGASLAAALPLRASSQDVGKAAPNFDMPGNGRTIRLADLKGRVVYVDFWASWCGPCKMSFPWMNDMQAKYADKGLMIVSVNTDKKREDAEKFLAST